MTTPRWRRKRIFTVLLLLLCLPIRAIWAAEEPTPVATYRASIEAERLASWLRFVGEGGGGERPIEGLILLEALADEALALGLDHHSEVRWELEQADLALVWQVVVPHAVAAVEMAVEVAEEEVAQLAARLQTKPRRVRLRNLFKRFAPDASSEAKAAVRATMEGLLARLRDGEDFKAMARAESDSQTRLQEGLLGNVRAGDLRPEIDAVAMALEEGQISSILEEEEGLTILYCESVLPAVERTPEDLARLARKRLRSQARKRIEGELNQDLLARAELTITWPKDLNAEPSKVVATWREGRLTAEDLTALVSLSRGSRTLAQLPREVLKGRIESLVIRRVARLRARRLGLGDRALVERRRWARRQILAGKALTRRVELRFEQVTDEELRQVFGRNRDAFTRPTHYRLEAIALPLDGDDARLSYQAAYRLIERLRRGELSFEEAARGHSRHPSASEGGRLGLWPERAIVAQLGRQVARAVAGLPIGQLSKPVEEASALWILRVAEVEPKREQTFMEARDRVEQKIGQTRAARLQSEATAELWRALDGRDGEGRSLVDP